jgi:cytochrome c peroxidase
MSRIARGIACLVFIAILGIVLVWARAGGAKAAAMQAGQSAFTPPRGLQSMPIPVPPDNPMTATKIRLGQQLFFDKRLSRTKQMSCETCHVPEKGWTDGLALSPRFDGSVNTRHSPTMYGVAYYPDLYWDLRAKGLEAQIAAAWRSQMGADPDAIAKEIEAIPAYNASFQKEFGGGPTGARIVQALATFVRTIHAGDTPWDRHPQDDASLKASEVGRGFLVFSDVAHCTNCHLPPLFSDTLPHNTGVGLDREKPDMGRGQILADAATKANQPVTDEMKKLMGAFKTPSLRGVALSAPYFHDGRAATLEEAVDFMLQGGYKNANLDEKLQAWTVTPTQRRELLAFLRSLTPATTYVRPTLP